MPDIWGGALAEVGIVQGGNTAAVLAVAATQDETLSQYLATAAALYGFDGTDLRRLLSTTAGLLRNTPQGSNEALADGVSNTIVAEQADGANALGYRAFPHLSNATTWDRSYNNHEPTLLASALRSSNTNTPVQTNYNAKGVVLFMNITARTVGASPLAALTIQAVDPIGASGENLLVAPNFTPTIDTHIFICFPGVGAVITGTYGANIRSLGALPIPRSWSCLIQHQADITNLTYSLAASYIL